MQHDKKLVFGYLREPNILMTKGDLKFVSLDLNGKEGNARCPADISGGDRRPQSIEVEGGTKVEHDAEWIKHQ